MLHDLGLLLAGLALLLIGGKLLVSASVDAARRLGVPTLLVGLTLVAWGTSAPEFALNIISAVKHRPELALGNVVGANICNMSLVLGVAALIQPLKVEERLIRVETLLNAAILGLMALFGLLGFSFTRPEAALLLGAFLLYTMLTIGGAVRQRTSPSTLVPTTEPEGFPVPPMSWWRITVLFIAGTALLSFGGDFASDSAADMARALRIPSAVVGATIVSIGTTLPELITSVLAVRRGQVDLAMGNAIGSCLFNTGAIFGIVGVIAPPAVPPSMRLSLGAMLLLALVLIPISRTFQRHVARIEGGLLLAVYAAFLAAQAVLAARAE